MIVGVGDVHFLAAEEVPETPEVRPVPLAFDGRLKGLQAQRLGAGQDEAARPARHDDVVATFLELGAEVEQVDF